MPLHDNEYPLAFLLTFTTYGTWLHGRSPGSVDREHNEPGTPFLPPDPEVEKEMQEKMSEPEFQLDAPRRKVVLATLLVLQR